MTALAIAIAIAAFALAPANKGIPRDAYTVAADRICVNGKEQVGAAGQRALRQRGFARVNAYASSLVLIVAQWRSAFDALSPPKDRVARAQHLDNALRDVEVGAGGLALAAQRRGGDVVGRARQLDGLTRSVERAISSLGLKGCARIVIAPVR